MEYLTVQEVAQYLKVPVSTVYRNWRQLGGVKIGRYIRISKERMDSILEAQKQGSPVINLLTNKGVQCSPGLMGGKVGPNQVKKHINQVRRHCGQPKRTKTNRQ